jgi:hypothetical protein
MLLLNTVSISLRAKIEQLLLSLSILYVLYCRRLDRVAPAPGSTFSRSRLLRATLYDLNEKLPLAHPTIFLDVELKCTTLVCEIS